MRPPGALASTLLALGPALLAGCRGSTAAAPLPGLAAGLAGGATAAVCPPGETRPATEEDVGLALAYSAAELPREIEALAAFVAARSGAAVVVDGVAAGGAPGALGVAGCHTLAVERVRVEPQGERLTLVPRRGAAAAQRVLAEDHLRAGRLPEARAALHAAASGEPEPLPDSLLLVGASYLGEERFDEAQAVFAEVTRRWPWSALGWAGLATARRRLERRIDAVDAATRAAALAPRALAQIPWLRGDPFVEIRAPLRPPAVWVPTGPEGGRWSFTAPSPPGAGTAPEGSGTPGDPQLRAEAVAYAGCKDAFRRSPELRQAAAGRALPAWRWTPAEESVCTLMWLRAYLGHRAVGRAADEELDAVAEIAQQGLLDERSLYDLALPADDRVALLLPEPRRARLLTFVARYRVVPRKDSGWLFP